MDLQEIYFLPSSTFFLIIIGQGLQVDFRLLKTILRLHLDLLLLEILLIILLSMDLGLLL